MGHSFLVAPFTNTYLALQCLHSKVGRTREQATFQDVVQNWKCNCRHVPTQLQHATVSILLRYFLPHMYVIIRFLSATTAYCTGPICTCTLFPWTLVLRFYPEPCTESDLKCFSSYSTDKCCGGASLVPRPPFNTARGGSGNETMEEPVRN